MSHIEVQRDALILQNAAVAAQEKLDAYERENHGVLRQIREACGRVAPLHGVLPAIADYLGDGMYPPESWKSSGMFRCAMNHVHSSSINYWCSEDGCVEIAVLTFPEDESGHIGLFNIPNCPECGAESPGIYSNGNTHCPSCDHEWVDLDGGASDKFAKLKESRKS